MGCAMWRHARDPALGGSDLRLPRQHRVLPVTDLEGLYHPLENEGVLIYELLGRSARLEDRHVTEVGERPDPDDITTREELVYDRLVSRKYFQDFFHAHAGGFSITTAFIVFDASGCCARAASGHTAVPLVAAINSRRFTRSPRRRVREAEAVP